MKAQQPRYIRKASERCAFLYDRVEGPLCSAENTAKENVYLDMLQLLALLRYNRLWVLRILIEEVE